MEEEGWNKFSEFLDKMNLTLVPVQNKIKKSQRFKKKEEIWGSKIQWEERKENSKS